MAIGLTRGARTLNYRHAYHAGNFADCFKHALLVELVRSLTRKSAPFFVLDTHAGEGRYNLDDQLARRTAEADTGIRRLLRKPDPGLAEYLRIVEQLGLYPGSPTILRGLLRENDSLACCELHPADAVRLKKLFRGDRQVAVHHRSGWEAITALLPPKEKRGLVFIDPPFEARDEFTTLADGLSRGHSRFAHGIFAGWYPIKQLSIVRDFHMRMAASGIRDIVAVELNLRTPTDPERLNGCGLIVINPPYHFECHAQVVANSVLKGVGNGEPGAGTTVSRLADE